MKIERKSYIKLTVIFILFILISSSIYLVFNLGTILDVGHYELNHNDRIDDENIKIDVQYLIDLRFNKYTDNYDGDLIINSSSNQSPDVLKGISFINFLLYKNGEIVHLENIEFDDLQKEYRTEFRVNLNKGDNFTAFGFITVLVNIDEKFKEFTSDFRLELSMDVSTWELIYQFEIGRLWLEYSLILCFFIILIFLIRSINQIYFQKNLPLAKKLRSDAYFEYIKQESKRKKRQDSY